MSSLIAAWDRFWFSAAPARSLHLVRVASGVLFLSWLLGYSTSYVEFFGPEGWIDSEALQSIEALSSTEEMSSSGASVSWSAALLPGSVGMLHAEYWLGVVVLILFTVGIATRWTAPLAWLTVVIFTSNPVLYYGGDSLLLVLAFYLMLGYLLMDLYPGASVQDIALGSSDAAVWKLKSSNGTPIHRSVWASVILRLIQIHFALIILMTGMHKLQVAEWWAGDALWYPLHPPFTTELQDVFDLRAPGAGGDTYLVIISLLAYLTIFWQLSFPFIAWTRTGRWVALSGAIAGWIGCVFIYGLPIFGPAFVIGALAFVLYPGTPEEKAA